MVSIAIEALSKRFGAAPVLSDIELCVDHGELFFLLGPSGCGKTTLLRHIAGFYRPDRGSIRFGGEDVTDLPAHRRGAGMMFQSYALWPHLSVAQNVAFGLEERKRPKREIRDRVEEALAAVQLAALGERRIQQLSGGQQQRVALARALVVRPKCLLLDEPLSNLDAKLRLEMRAEIRRICKESGLTGIYVTHDQEEALSMADRLAVMDGGRLVQVGTAVEVYRHPANRMVAEFIGETNFIEGRVMRAAEEPASYAVDTAAGVLLARSRGDAWSPGAGAPVTLSVRPEALRFTGDGAGSPNRFTGRLTEATYLGATAQYRVRIGETLSLKVTELNPERLRQPSPEAVTVAASPDDLVMLPV